MPELDSAPSYNPAPKGKWPHPFTSGYVPLFLKRLHLGRRYRFDRKATTMLLTFVWFQLIQGKSCWLYSKLYFSKAPPPSWALLVKSITHWPNSKFRYVLGCNKERQGIYFKQLVEFWSV